MDSKTQLFFRDDNKFQFIRRELKYSSLVEKAGDTLKRAWKHFYGTEIPFLGYKNISAGMVTLGFTRDIVLDPFNKVPVGEEMSDKPNPKDKNSLKRWIAKIAENQRHIFRSKRQSSNIQDWLNWSLIGVLFLLAFGWLIRFTTG